MKRVSKNSNTLKILCLLCISFISPLSYSNGKDAAEKTENSAIRIDIGVDYNRDGIITFPSVDDPFKPTSDTVTADEPYVFWINNDNDLYDQETTGSDIPGVPNDRGDFNWRTSKFSSIGIDGTRDLIDFFPIAIDFNDFFERVPNAEDHIIRILHQDEAVNAIYTEMSVDNVDYYLRNLDVTNKASLNNLFGSWQDSDKELNTVPVVQVDKRGTNIRFPKEYIDFIKKNNNQAVLMIEGRNISNKPLILKILSPNYVRIYQKELPIKIVDVESMYAISNVRAAASKGKKRNAKLYAPSKTKTLKKLQQDIIAQKNVPASFDKNKTFVFLHGFKVDHNGARAWFSEVFKRLYHSGSNAMFVGISWNSSEGKASGLFNYWGNVENALNSAETVSTVLQQGIDGQITLASHSLGNMLLGEAISKYNLTANGYFMLDPAVPIEAYDSSQLAKPSTGKNAGFNLMFHPDWHKFYDKDRADNPRRLFASDWHRLFEPSDHRSQLTWSSIFETVPSRVNNKLYQFYSTGEEVLAKSDGSLPSSSDAVLGGALGQNSWIIQEKHKGLASLSNGFTEYQGGGWGFNCDLNGIYCPGVEFDDEYVYYPPEEIFLFSDEKIMTPPFFKRMAIDNIHSEFATLASQAALDNREHILAYNIPSLSHAAGGTGFKKLKFKEKTFNMMELKNGWPAVRTKNNDNDWYHSDAKDIAYLYVHQVYDKWVKLGELK